jgi:MFS_1 like family
VGLALLLGLESQQPTWPQAMHCRRLTQVAPIGAQSSQTSPGSRIVLPAHGRTGRGSLRRDVVAGFGWTLHHAAVRTLALTILIFNVTFGAAWSVLVLYARERLGLGPVGFGLITTVSAVGGLLGTLLYGWITRRVSPGNVMRVGLVIETLTHLGLAVATSPWIASPILFVFGAHAFIWGTTAVTRAPAGVDPDRPLRPARHLTAQPYCSAVATSCPAASALWPVTKPTTAAWVVASRPSVAMLRAITVIW